MIIVGVLLCWLHTVLALLVVDEEDRADVVVDVVVVVVASERILDVRGGGGESDRCVPVSPIHKLLWHTVWGGYV